MPISEGIYTSTQLTCASTHARAATLSTNNESFLDLHADDSAGDAVAAAAATSIQLVQVIQYHAELFFLTADATYRPQAIFAAEELVLTWPRGFSAHELVSSLPLPVMCNLAKAVTLDPDLYDTLEPIFDTVLAGIADGTQTETGFGDLMAVRIQLGWITGSATSPFDNYGDVGNPNRNLGMTAMLSSTYIHSTGHINWWPGSSWYVITNAVFWLRLAGEKIKGDMTAGQLIIYNLACRIAIPFTWHGITLYVGEDIDVGRGAEHADYPTVGFPWYHVDEDDDSRWLRYHGYQQIANAERALAWEDLLVPDVTVEPPYPAHANEVDVVLGQHLLITYTSVGARIRQVSNGTPVLGSHTTDSERPQTAHFDDTGFMFRTFDNNFRVNSEQLTGGMSLMSG